MSQPTQTPRYINKREAAKVMTQQHWAEHHAKQAMRFRDESTRAATDIGQRILERWSVESQIKAAQFSQQAMCMAGVL